LHISRHLAQISLDRRKPACTQFIQSDENLTAQILCGIALKADKAIIIKRYAFEKVCRFSAL